MMIFPLKELIKRIIKNLHKIVLIEKQSIDGSSHKQLHTCKNTDIVCYYKNQLVHLKIK